jgi:2-isopropylmalate synthase
MYENLILKVTKGAAAGALKKHFKEIGERYVFCDKNNNPGGNIYAIAREVHNVEEPGAHLDEHIHTVENLMIFLGFEKGLTGLTAEVTLGNEKYFVESPSAVFVPPGLKHSFKFIRGSGLYVNFLPAPAGDYNAVTK